MIRGWAWSVTWMRGIPKRLRLPRKRASKCRCNRAGQLADVITIPPSAFPASNCILIHAVVGGNHVCHFGSHGKHRIGGCQEVTRQGQESPRGRPGQQETGPVCE